MATHAWRLTQESHFTLGCWLRLDQRPLKLDNVPDAGKKVGENLKLCEAEPPGAGQLEAEPLAVPPVPEVGS